MQISYDPQVNAMYVQLQPHSKIADSDEVDDGVIVDYDSDGKLIGIEFLDADLRMPAALQQALHQGQFMMALVPAAK